ncbi:uncharacterized protein LOC114281359 [Camellia sinensis]|uniref:uncharacterized protein LOC114281359 n=1 Tax=Camellia sinensis TaxID=4442 RepID=UPI001035E871|nr:uncharacterized protein LOC114281359 [Camellia sinensis]
MKIQSWNVRGLGRLEKRRKIKRAERKISLVLIQETKRSTITPEVAKSIWYEDNIEYMAVDAEGRAGTLFSSFNCVIVNVYDPSEVAKRKELWVNFAQLKNTFLGPWCMGGDFNEIRTISERIGCSRRDRGMREFNTMIDQLEMIDLPMLVEETWSESQVVGWARYKCLKKFKALKQKLKVWNIEVFGKIEFKIKAAEEEAHAIELIAEERALLGHKQARRRELMGEVWRLNKMLEWTWLQKSRMNWALKGERNTRYFHIMACNRNSRNSLCSMMVNGVMVEEPIEVRHVVMTHFMNLFSETWAVRPQLSVQFKNIDGSQAADILEVEFTEEEVRNVIN